MSYARKLRRMQKLFRETWRGKECPSHHITDDRKHHMTIASLVERVKSNHRKGFPVSDFEIELLRRVAR